MSADVRTEALGPAIVVTLARPQKRNALAVETVRQLAQAIENATSRGARAVVITGEPPAFCAGGDLDDLLGVAASGAEAATNTIYGNFHRLVRTIRGAPVPVIAAVNGAAIGAGLDLALACDLRVAATAASFASSWIGMGLVPGMGGAYLLPGLVGGTRAAELLLTGASLDAQTALEWGLVNAVVEPHELVTRTNALVTTIGALPPEALALTKAAFHRGVDATFEQELATLGVTQGLLLTGAEFSAAVAKFKGKS